MTNILGSILLFALVFPVPTRLQSQEARPVRMEYILSAGERMLDSALAMRVPLLAYPASYLERMLPAAVDNAQQLYWPGVHDQYNFFTCQQYCGVVYVFGYEINRLRNLRGADPKNYYPSHYTWNFMNRGGRHVGVDFLQSFEVIRRQGHMTSDHYGFDTATSVLGWISGYDKYYHGMFNRLKQVSAIKVNSAEGINALRNYLYDHLDGSATGGIACFTTSSAPLNNLSRLPEGTPEGGKNLIPFWLPNPGHGLTVIGYNDSIRYDVNSDGKYTNDIDITGDGVTDARDWETGGFRIANSYGTWWADAGYAWSLYRNFAFDYGEGGIWNNRVYVAEADTGYKPLLTFKIRLNYNARDKIRVLAGVSSDTLDEIPAHVMEFPIFSFQGGSHAMQGDDADEASRLIEFGLDVTPLLNEIPSGQPARFFMAVEERDPDHTGQGVIERVSMISYAAGVNEMVFDGTDIAIKDNHTTFVSAVASFEKPDLRITTPGLPSFTGTPPLQVMLAAEGGRPPYRWSLVEDYARRPTDTPEPLITGTSIMVPHETGSFATVALPFSFPFYGKTYDTVYVNYFGFAVFEHQYLPLPYTTEEAAMLRMFPVIAPAFSQQYIYQSAHQDGIWCQADTDRAIIRWKVTLDGDQDISTSDFALILYADGRFECCYGLMDSQHTGQLIYRGVSKGDGVNSDIVTEWETGAISGESFIFHPPVVPAGIGLSNSGMLTVDQADPARIYEIMVRVHDAGMISDTKTLLLTSGLEIVHELESDSGNKLIAGQPARVHLTLKNTGAVPVTELVLHLVEADSLLDIADSSCTVALIDPGQTVSVPAAFQCSLHHALSDGYPVMVALQSRSGQGSWNKALLFRVAAAEIDIGTPCVKDGFNDRLDPGEVADLAVTLTNSGSLGLRNLSLELVTGVADLEILSDSMVAVGRLDALSLGEYSFRLRASSAIPPGTAVPVQIRLSDTSGIVQSCEYMLRIGAIPVAIADLSDSHGSASAMMEALEILQVTYDTVRSLESDLRRYECIFLILGTATTGTHALTGQEGDDLTSYLMQGGNLYLESYWTWYYHNNTALHPFFKYTSKKVHAYYFPEVRGVAETFCDAISFGYNVPLNYSVFSFEPVAPAFATLTNTDNPPKNLEIAYNGDDYKTIGTMTGFGSFTTTGHPSTLTDLMERYLGFFDINLTGPWPLFHAGTTSVCRGQHVAFTDDSYDNITSRQWEFPGGTPSSSTEMNPVVRYDTPGRWDVSLTVSDGTHTKSIRKKQYIDVGDCQGADDFPSAQPLFRVFPNPVSGNLTVVPGRDIAGPITLVLCDIAGRRVMQSTLPGSSSNQGSLDLSGILPGLYFLTGQAGKEFFTVKIVK